MQTREARGAIHVPMTCERIREALRRLDLVIGNVAGRGESLDPGEFRTYLALRRRRIALRLLLAARRAELRKKVVSLERWRFGRDGVMRQ